MRTYKHREGPKLCKQCGFKRPLADFPYSAGQYRSLCHEHWAAYCAEQREKRRDTQRAYDRARYERDPEAARARARSVGVRRRWAVLQYYGGATPACACCGESAVEFLAIDHIDGGGEQHRNHLKADGTSLYRWLIEQSFPVGYRVLCHNCNSALGYYGYCPHRPA
jgi:hypothetical protein